LGDYGVTDMSLSRITHKHVEQACERYNRAIGATAWNSRGRLQWADIRGDGRNRRGLYVVINDNGGVGTSHLRGITMRETIRNIDHAIRLDKLPDYAVIIRCIHDRGTDQISALAELKRRGLWLNAEQREQAGLPPSD